MKKLSILLFLVVFQAHNYAQEKETISQHRKGLVGLKSKDDFKQEPYVKWFDNSFENYELDSQTIQKLKPYANKFKIKVFMSVWCHDSKREIPRLYKILEAINFNGENIEVIALNRVKKTPDNLQEGFNVIRTPTIIFYKNDKELGRFVEHPRKSLEKDMLRVVSGKSYRHAYYKH